MTKAEKVLVVLARLCEGRDSAVPYEDLVVAAFEAFPRDFCLRGYPQYPDASDIHKPVYNHLRPKGFVRVANKTFRITAAGRARADEIERANNGADTPVEAKPKRLTRSQSAAVQRYRRSAAVELVEAGRQDELIDTDCQRFYGFAAWSTPKEAMGLRADFLATLSAVKDINKDLAEILRRTDEALFSRFSSIFGDEDAN